MSSLEAKKRQVQSRSPAPSPVAVSPSGDFDGNDGPWSTFAFRVGEPEQVVKLLVGTTSSETWVVDEGGCNDLASTCPNDRGWLFNETRSKTWRQNNIYDIPVDKNLGTDISGQYGFDTVGLGWQGSGGPSVNQSVVAGIAAPDFFLGIFGVSFRPANFSGFDNPQPSYLTLLRKSGVIPSLSYGYTAGASNRPPGFQGSLTLGGYDSSLFESNNVSFNMDQVTYRDLVVGVQSISIQLSQGADRKYSTGFYSFIDATASHIWLPLAACEMFEEAFGIAYDPSTGLYPVNDTLHSQLMSQNASVSFELSTAVNDGPTVTITLPYSSFDLLATSEYPGLQNETRYFPIRRAANESQFTLGRTFLQDAYLTVDYERSSFSLNQRVFDSQKQQNLTALEPPASAKSNTTELPTVGRGADGRLVLSAGAIAGISIGALAFILLAIGTWLLLRKKVKRKQTYYRNEESKETTIWQDKPELEERVRYELEEQKPEIDGRQRHELEESEPRMARSELVGEDFYTHRRTTELPGQDVSTSKSGAHVCYELE